MNDILRFREICRRYSRCLDGCPFFRGFDCLVAKPPSAITDEEIEQINDIVRETILYSGIDGDLNKFLMEKAKVIRQANEKLMKEVEDGNDD